MKISSGASYRRLRIALLVDRFGSRFGGAEAYGVELMRVLGQRHAISVVARDFESALPFPFLPVRFPRGFPSWMRVLYFAWRAHRYTRGRYDIVHSHMNGWAGDVQVMHVIPVRYQRLYRTPWFKQLAAWISPRLTTYLLLEKSRLRRTPSRRVVAVSALIAQQLHASYGPDLPVVTIPPGVTLPPATDPLRRAATRARLGWSDDTQACLLVARDPLRKGLHTLLNALAQLPVHYQLLVVGADAASRKRLRASPSLATRVTLLPPSTQVPLYFEAADIYVHPTLNDSYGMAPLEAMAHRLPVVLSAAPYCGLAQYLRPDEDALLLPDPHDAVQLAQAIVRIGSDMALRARLIANGLGVARENSWEKVAARYEALYAELLAQRSQAVLDASI